MIFQSRRNDVNDENEIFHFESVVYKKIRQQLTPYMRSTIYSRCWRMADVEQRKITDRHDRVRYRSRRVHFTEPINTAN